MSEEESGSKLWVFLNSKFGMFFIDEVFVWVHCHSFVATA